jgi:hypothetical protein
LTGPFELWPAGIEFQEAVEPALAEGPVTYRPGVDVNKTRLWIPADPAAPHRPGSGHRIGKPCFEAKVERVAQDMLAVLGNTKGGAGEYRIGLGRTVGGKDRRFGLADGIEHIGEEIDHPDIQLRLLPGVMIAEENAEFADDRFDRALIIAVCAIKSLPPYAR